MKRAGEMIRSNKQVYIKEVAAAVGFDDPYFFSRKISDAPQTARSAWIFHPALSDILPLQSRFPSESHP